MLQLTTFLSTLRVGVHRSAPYTLVVQRYRFRIAQAWKGKWQWSSCVNWKLSQSGSQVWQSTFGQFSASASLYLRLCWLASLFQSNWCFSGGLFHTLCAHWTCTLHGTLSQSSNRRIGLTDGPTQQTQHNMGIACYQGLWTSYISSDIQCDTISTISTILALMSKCFVRKRSWKVLLAAVDPFGPSGTLRTSRTDLPSTPVWFVRYVWYSSV